MEPLCHSGPKVNYFTLFFGRYKDFAGNIRLPRMLSRGRKGARLPDKNWKFGSKRGNPEKLCLALQG